MIKNALLIGATGLTGKDVLINLLNNPIYQSVTIVTRHKLDINNEKLKQHVSDFKAIKQLAPQFENIDHVYCCLGTTIKKAKSKENFAAIDYDLVINLAKLAKQSNVDKFLVISSIGANPTSKAFYSATKGKMEVKLKTLHLANTFVFRPSLLLGKRNEFRLLERLSESLASLLSFLFIGPLTKYKPINASDVALAMIATANFASLHQEYQWPLSNQTTSPTHDHNFIVIENQQIRELANLSNTP